MTKRTRWLLEQSLYKLADVRDNIDEGTWQNEDRDWKRDLDELTKKIVVELQLDEAKSTSRSGGAR